MKLFMWWQRWFDSPIKTKGWCIPALSAPHRKNYLHPMQWGEIWGLRSGKGKYPARCFLPCSARSQTKKSLLLSCINFSSLQSVDKDARISTQCGTQSSPHSLGREKGFQLSQEKKTQKTGSLLTFLVGSAWQELKDPFPEWLRLWVCCKNQSLSNRKVSNVLSLKKNSSLLTVLLWALLSLRKNEQNL